MQGLTMRGVRRALAACAAVGLLFTATGCFKLDMDLQVRPDDSVGGTLTVAWSEEFLEEATTGEDAISRSELDALLEALIAGVPDTDRRQYAEAGYVGQTATFTGRPLEDFADFGGDEWGYLHIDREGRRYLLDGHWDLRTTGFLEAEAMQEAEVLIEVTFPAPVKYHNGQVEGRTVTWTMSPGEEYDMRAVAVRHNGWLWVGVTAAATVAVLGLVWLWQWARLREHSLGERKQRS